MMVNYELEETDTMLNLADLALEQLIVEAIEILDKIEEKH